jgi:hypothetical protein
MCVMRLTTKETKNTKFKLITVKDYIPSLRDLRDFVVQVLFDQNRRVAPHEIQSR